METLHFAQTPSPAGLLRLVASHKGLVRLEFQGRERGIAGADLHESESALRLYLDQLRQFFNRERREFSLPLDLRGTPFQLACWNALLEIPYGETRSYAEIARAISHPTAFRAVGMANNRNPIAIIVPCHRVIASSGSLCGYGGGLDLKSKLLELEGAVLGSPCLPLALGA